MDPASEGLAGGVCGESFDEGPAAGDNWGGGGGWEGDWKGGYQASRAGELGWDGGVLPGLARQRRGHGTGRTGRLLAGVPVAGSWGGQGASWRILGSWAAFCLRGAVLGRRSPNRQQTVRAPSLGASTGAPPPRVAALGPRRRWQGAGSAPCLGGKGPQDRRPRVQTRPPRDPADSAPRETPAWLFPTFPKGRRAPAAGSPAPGARLSS